MQTFIVRLQHLNLAVLWRLIARLLKGLTFGCTCARFSAIRASTRDVEQVPVVGQFDLSNMRDLQNRPLNTWTSESMLRHSNVRSESLRVTQISEPNLPCARRNRQSWVHTVALVHWYDYSHLLMNTKLEPAKLNLHEHMPCHYHTHMHIYIYV